MPGIHVPLAASARRESGLSLIELMISIAIGMLLLAGLTTLIVHQSRTREELDKASQQIENGRYAVQLLKDDIEHAGFYGQYYSIPTPGATLPDPCATDLASLVDAMSLPVQGYDSPATVPSPLSACLNDANHIAGTDILVVRRADSSTTSIASAAAEDGGLVYLQTTTASLVMATGSGASTTKFPLTYSTTTNTGTADLRAYQTHIYFVSPCSTMANGSTCTSSDDGGNPIPTLKRLELSSTSGATTFVLTPLVEGVENLQLDYGIDSNSDGYPETYVPPAPATAAAWANVMSVRVGVLARNTESTPGYTDSKTYNLGEGASSVSPAATSYKHHAYSTVVRAINPSGRRAQN